jgi:hypothetical protein
LPNFLSISQLTLFKSNVYDEGREAFGKYKYHHRHQAISDNNILNHNRHPPPTQTPIRSLKTPNFSIQLSPTSFITSIKNPNSQSNPKTQLSRQFHQTLVANSRPQIPQNIKIDPFCH